MQDIGNSEIKMVKQKCKDRGYSFDVICTLAFVVTNCVAYKFKRGCNNAWQYEVVMPGYGKMPNMDKWIDVTVIK